MITKFWVDLRCLQLRKTWPTAEHKSVLGESVVNTSAAASLKLCCLLLPTPPPPPESRQALTESGEDLLERRERDIFNAAVINGDLKSAAAVAERQNCAEDFGQGQSNDDQGGGGGGGDPAMVDGARTGASVLSWVLGRPSGLEFADGRGQVVEAVIFPY